MKFPELKFHLLYCKDFCRLFDRRRSHKYVPYSLSVTNMWLLPLNSCREQPFGIFNMFTNTESKIDLSPVNHLWEKHNYEMLSCFSLFVRFSSIFLVHNTHLNHSILQVNELRYCSNTLSSARIVQRALVIMTLCQGS